MISCIIIDDEPLAIKVIENFIEKVDFLTCVSSFSNAPESINFLKKNKVDLMFLDINMPFIDGISFLKKLTDPPKTIITSAHSEYALESYDLNVTDYLLKPISFERFEIAVTKVFNILNDLESNSKKIFLSKGVHLVIDRSRLNLKQSLYFDIGDGRMMFAIPRQGKVYFGTTDTEFHGNLNQIEISIEDCSYLIGAVNRRFPQANIVLEDIESCWAGLRPLIRKSEKSTTEMSRKDEVFIAPSGIISIAGGKLTGFRKMAERVVNIVEQRLFRKKTPCLTAYHSFKSKSFTSPSVSTYHNFTYGTAAESILGQLDPGSDDALIQEYIYCIDEECCINPLDYFLRRSGKMYFNISAVEQELELCLKTFKNYLNWNDKQTEQARKNILESIERHRLTKIKKASIN